MLSATGIVEWGNEYTLYQVCEMYNLYVTVFSPFRLHSGIMFLHEKTFLRTTNAIFSLRLCC